MRGRVLAGVAAAALLAAGAGAILMRTQPTREVPHPEARLRPAEASKARPEPGADEASGPSKPALYCQFYVFVESRPFVAFMFEQTQDGAGVYRQVYVAKADGDRTDYNAAVGRRPEWRLDATADPPRLEGRVTTPNASQAGVGEEDIAIELRGFDPASASEGWHEASLKSVFYQNLLGKCRRTRV